MDNLFKDHIRDLLIFDDLSPEQSVELFTDALNEVESEIEDEDEGVISDIEEAYEDLVD